MGEADRGDLTINLRLGCEVGGGCVPVGVHGKPHVQFREVNLDTERGESCNVGLDAGDVRVQISVHLQPDAIDGDTAALEVFHHGIEGVRLRIHGFRSAVVIEEKRVGVGLMSPAERLFNVGGRFACEADSRLVIPDGRFHFSVLVEPFVEHIPGEHLAAIVSGYARDVLVQDVRELLHSESLASQPGRVGPSPDQGVTTHLHAVRFGEPDDLVALSEVEGRLVGAKDPPFHRIFGLDHIELAAERGGVLLFGQSIGPHRGPDQEAKRIGLLAQRLSEAGRSQAHAHEQKS